MRGKIFGVGAVALALSTSAAPAMASTEPASGGPMSFTVTVSDQSTMTTLQDTAQGPKPVPLSPGAYAVYTGQQNPVFVPGQMAGKGLENIAEDGFPMMLAGTLSNTPGVTDSGTFASPAGKNKALGPKETASFTITATRGEKLSLATMFVPSNDWFYGPADGISLFDANGAPISGDVTNQLGLYDAGTEQNQQFYGPATKPVQPSPDFGPTTNDPIQPAAQTQHPGAIPPADQVIRLTIRPMPRGGAATGGGSTSGTEDVALIGLGGAALLAGSILLFARRRRTVA